MDRTFDNDAFVWLDNNELSYTIWNNKYRNGNESFSEWLNRVSNNNASIIRLIKDKKFLFGGRTLSNRGTGKGSYNNCYSIGFVPDSLEGIMDVNTKIALTYKAQGGEGLDLSYIRPKGTLINGKFESDGIVPFMEMFNTTTSSISQGGSRKGALMMSLDFMHKEIETFVSIKSDMSKINKANLSVTVSDDIMRILQNSYNNGTLNEPKIIQINKTYEGKDIIYTLDIHKVFNLICEKALKTAEPGFIFADPFRNYNIMEFVSSYIIETCNPCGEQPLPKHGCCALASINLSEYIVDPYTKESFFDISSFKKDMWYAVKAMDELIDENADNHALQEQKDMALNYRNIGIGYMGIADMLVKLELIYGSKEACNELQHIAKEGFRAAVECSSYLAKTKGTFPMYSNEVWKSAIINNAFSLEEINQLKKQGLRNCALLSIAPTGSIGTMLNIGTGMEPYFALSYKRKTESLHRDKEEYYDVYVKEAAYYLNNVADTLPKYFISSGDINYIDRINMQAALQTFIDTAISSTINLPKGTTIEDIQKLYLYAWEMGLKGVTVYVDGSRDPILSKEVPKIIEGRQSPKRPDVLEADFYSVKVKGEQFTVLVGLLNNKPYEIFTFRLDKETNIKPHRGTITRNKKKHYSFDSDLINISDIQLANDNIEEKAATLYSSMLLRHGVSIPYIVKTSKKVNENITSFSSAMCRILSKYIKDEYTGEICPECGSPIKYVGGCKECSREKDPLCTYSKCG